MKRKVDPLEVSSDQVTAELIEIKERIGSLETITSLANRPVVEAQARSHLTTPQRRAIMKMCEAPRTREQLKQDLGYESLQALDHHLRPLRDGDLIHQHGDSGGRPTFVWSKLFKSLPKATQQKILDSAK
jgi:hypothetical protein